MRGGGIGEIMSPVCANEPAKPRNPPENGEKNTDLALNLYIIRHESRHPRHI